MNVSPITNSPPQLMHTNSFILTQRTFEGISYWLNNLKPDQKGTLKLDECQIANSDALARLIKELPTSIKTLDFSQCTFTDHAFSTLLMNEKAPCNWILAWAGNQTMQINAAYIQNISLTLLPPKAPTAEEIELVQFLAKQTSVDISPWGIDTDSRSTFQILAKPNFIKEEHLAYWREVFQINSNESGIFTLNNDALVYFHLDKQEVVNALFEVMREASKPIKELDLSGIVFSDEVWKITLDHFKTGYKIDNLTVDSATIPQLKLLFQEWSEMLAQNIENLNLSRCGDIWTTNQERSDLKNLLKNELPKLNKLQTLKVDNWNADIQCDKLIKKTINPPEQKALLLSQNTSQETWKQSLSTCNQPTLAIGEPNTAPLLINSTDSIDNLFSALNQSHSALAFQSIHFTVDAWMMFLLQLYKLKSAKSLSFSNCQLNPSMIASLQSLSHLRSLTLNSNAALAEKETFCQAIKTVYENIELETLSLEDNLLTDQDIATIFPTLPGGLTKLCLAGNCIGTKGANHLHSLPHKSFTGRKRVYGNLPTCHIDLEDNPIAK